MKKVFDVLKNSPIVFVFVLIMIFFMVPNLAAPSETVENSIITVVGIDFDTEYELSFLTFVPTPGKAFVEQYNVVSTKGETLAEIVDNAGLQMGKIIRLAHTKTAVLGKGVVEQDVSQTLSFLVGVVSLSKSCMVITTNDTAKNLLNFIQEQDKDAGDKLQYISRFNTASFYFGESSVESFFNGYYSPMNSAFLGYMELNDIINDEGVLINEEQDSKKEMVKELVNSGEIMLFKNGKNIGVVEEEIVKGLNWINKSIKEQAFKIDLDTGVQEVFFIKAKNVNNAVKIQDGVPYFRSNILLKIDRVEINGADKKDKNNIRLVELDDEKREKIQKLVKTEFEQGLNVLKEKKADIINVYELFYQRKRREFKKYLETLENKEDFLDFIVFEMKVKVESD